jgi:signal transduction histidine kinase
MGLPIVDSIMRLHGGNVNLVSTSKGTRVTLGMPRPNISNGPA